MLLAFILTLLYVALVYLRLWEWYPDWSEAQILPFFMIASIVAWLPGRDKRLDAPQHRLLLAFWLLMGLSVAIRGWLGGGVQAIVTFLPVVVLFFLVSSTTNTVARHRAFMMVIGAATTFLAVHGIDQSINLEGWSGTRIRVGGRITYRGIFYDPNDLALAFVLAIPMIVYALRNAGILGKAIWLASLAAVYYGIFLTNSRGGMLAAMAQVFIFLVRRFGLWAASLAGLVGLAGLLALPSRLDQIDAGEESAAGRVDAWYAGLEMLAQYPVFGVGKGNFTEHNLLTAHNSFVLVFAEMGLLGYFLWLSFVVLSFYMVYSIATQRPADSAAAPDPAAELPQIAAVYFYSMVGFFIGAFFLSRSYNLLLYVLCGLCVALYQTTRALPGGWPEVTFKPLAGRMLAATLGSVVGFWVLVRILLVVAK